jgi:hypothetical protein
MKKLTTLIALAAFALCGNTGYAQSKPANKTGSAAAAGKMSTSDHFAWGIGLGALVVIGIIVGVTVVAATGDSN